MRPREKPWTFQNTALLPALQGLGRVDALDGPRKEGEQKMTDKRRYGVIEVRRINAETYHLTINAQMWSEVEWSRSRQRWCIQDAAGHCLAHVEHIVGQDRDVQAAIRLAKKMIVDGR